MRILVVDDQVAAADSLVSILKEAGHEAVAVYDGRAAIEAARRFQPEVLLTDVIMPEMNGLEVVARIRDILPNCKVFMISGDPKSVDVFLGEHMMDADFKLVPKPVHPEDLLQKIKVA